MKILIISNMYPSRQKPYSGIFVLNQYDYLRKVSGLSVVLFAMKRTFTNRVGSAFKYMRACVRFTPHLFETYHVVHVHFFYPLIILAVIYKMCHPRSRIIVTFHGSDINSYMNNRVDRAVFKAILKKVTIAISVGHDLGEMVERKLGRKSDVILSAGVDDSVFYPESSTQKEFDFIFVGSFIERKGVDILIDAIRIVDNQSIRYCFVGSGPYLGEIMELKKEYSITIRENQSQHQLRKLYNQAKFFVLPSRSEPFGLVATEALFCGLPILVSSNGGLKDQVRDGVNGFIVESGQAEEYAHKMNMLVKLSSEEYRALVVEALKSNKKHSLSHVCETLIELYNNKE